MSKSQRVRIEKIEGRRQSQRVKVSECQSVRVSEQDEEARSKEDRGQKAESKQDEEVEKIQSPCHQVI